MINIITQYLSFYSCRSIAAKNKSISDHVTKDSVVASRHPFPRLPILRQAALRIIGEKIVLFYDLATGPRRSIAEERAIPYDLTPPYSALRSYGIIAMSGGL